MNPLGRDHAGRLRERPPHWPRHEPDFGPGPRRWERDREVFEDGAYAELYPGSLVMEDLVLAEDDAAMVRVLARYTVVRVLVLSAEGALPGSRLRLERRIALEHLGLLPEHDWERRSLERVAGLCRETPVPEIVEAITVAAEAAAKRSQVMGAFALYRSAYEMSCRAGWWAEGSHAARGIARLARLEEARYSVRLWERRAYVLERRAVRAAAAADAEPPAG